MDGKDMRESNKGFSLVELIIAIAIMAVLTGAVVPNFLEYLGKAKRTSDVASAKQIVEAMDMMLLLEDSGIEVNGKQMVGFMWNKDSKSSGGTDNLYIDMINSFKELPVSKYNKDFFWCMYYTTNSFGYLDVKSLYLLENPGDTMGYELYPDPSKYLENVEKVKVAEYE